LVFFDTSALVKAYVTESGSDAVKELIDRCRGSLWLSDMVALEVMTTFALQVRDRRMRPSTYARARMEFFTDLSHMFNRVRVDEFVIVTAVKLANEHRHMSVGALDLLHVATALHADTDDELTIVCADRAMRNLAAAAGFRVFNPETDDPITLAAG
jgi:predicted nucleic acid-binding protein